MNNIEYIKPLGKDGRYHITDLKIGDIAYLNGVEGKLTLEGDRIVFMETGAFSGKWTINPTAEGWISDITGVRRPFDVRLKRAIRRIEQRDRRIAGLERRISMLEGSIAEDQLQKYVAKQGMPSDIRIVYLVNAITDALARASTKLRHAIRKIRTGANLDLAGYDWTKASTPWAEYAEDAVLNAARDLGIDLGASNPGKLDVSDL